MNEALRLAYLDAMGITAWAPRAAGETAVIVAEATLFTDAETGRASVVDRSMPSSHRHGTGGLAAELFGSVRTAPAAVPRADEHDARSRAAPITTAAEVGTMPTLLLVTAGRHIFISEAGDPQHDARVAALAAAIAFAISGERSTASMQRFDPAMSGLAADRARARDVLLGLLIKLTETTDGEHLILLGSGAATALLGWDEQSYRQRRPRIHAVDGLRAGVLVTVAAARLLEEPSLKASAWQELCAARGGQGA